MLKGNHSVTFWQSKIDQLFVENGIFNIVADGIVENKLQRGDYRIDFILGCGSTASSGQNR